MDSLVDASPPILARHRITARQYELMEEVGILGPEDRTELIDGEVIDMPPIGFEHMDAVNGLNRALVLACEGRAIVSVQNPIWLGLRSVPQPDFAVFRQRRHPYSRDRPPGPADTLLLVEVAASSLPYDRSVKLPLYARAGIVEFWIVDLAGRGVDRYRSPDGETYRDHATHRTGNTIALAADPAIAVPLDVVFG